jgi:hypothetical protein
LRRSATAIQITSSRRTVKMTSFYRRSPLHSVLSPWIYIYLFRNLAMSNCVSPHWVLQSECISFWRDWNYIQLCNSWNRLYDGVTKSFRTESITIYTLTTIYTRWETTQRVMAANLTRLTHKIAIQLHLVVESCTIWVLAPRDQSGNFSIHPCKCTKLFVATHVFFWQIWNL